jgi:hypothetical protein
LEGTLLPRKIKIRNFYITYDEDYIILRRFYPSTHHQAPKSNARGPGSRRAGKAGDS